MPKNVSVPPLPVSAFAGPPAYGRVMSHTIVNDMLGAAAHLLPSDDDVAAYRARGYWISPKILSDEVLVDAVAGQDRFYAGHVDHPPLGTTRYDSYNWTPDRGLDVLRKNDMAHARVDALAAVARSAIIGAVAARLSGSDEIRLWHDQLLYKPSAAPGTSGNVGWHTDLQYWGTCSSREMLTAWVPFEGCDEELGTITFLEGSHRWDAQQLDFFDGDLDAQEQRLADAGLTVRKIPAVLERGQVSFHHCRLVHGSGANVSGRPRRSMAVHLQTGDNHWVQRRREDGTLEDHANDDLVRTLDEHPDYADPRVCPRLWPEA